MNVNNKLLKAIVIATVFQSLLILLLEIKNYYSQKAYMKILNDRPTFFLDEESNLSFTRMPDCNEKTFI